MYYGERLNSSTHLMGTVLAVAGAAVLVVLAARLGDPWKIVSFSVYGFTLFALYALSTLYHSTRGKLKRVFQKLDHCSIYLLIAGTYTPFALVTLRGAWGWSLFGVIWGLAVAGIALRAAVRRVPRGLFVALYLAMGWAVVVALRPLVTSVARGGVVLLVCGGIVYTVGIAFYLWRRLAYHHAIWHGFVLVGSVLHFFAILFYVIPLADSPVARG